MLDLFADAPYVLYLYSSLQHLCSSVLFILTSALLSNSPDVLLVLQQSAEARLDVAPRALVLVLLLAPHQLRVRVLGYLRLDQVVRERRDLFQSASELRLVEKNIYLYSIVSLYFIFCAKCNLMRIT